ncbi:MAG: aminoacyl-tRNA hydrolase [Coriobacteriia bacterium]|nr:aminoacyl-tRNA hydrolase [Coriobacteriia bacterium]
MRLIVGLGNPGEEYELTRHNAGFMVVDSLAEDFGINYWKTKAGALLAETTYKGQKLIIAKPQSYMNTSGGPMKKIMGEYGIALEETLVIHDEMDIDKGSARIKFGGGHAGHNGLRSIIEKCGSKDFSRVRIGIGHPPGKMRVADYVLSVPKASDALLFEQALTSGAQAVLACLDEGVAKAMSLCNARA